MGRTGFACASDISSINEAYLSSTMMLTTLPTYFISTCDLVREDYNHYPAYYQHYHCLALLVALISYTLLFMAELAVIVEFLILPLLIPAFILQSWQNWYILPQGIV
jgi:hypothetical protein